MKILNAKSLKFLEEYLNNAAPTGYESNGQRIWMKYLKPYVDEFITDNYGTAVGVINPEKKFKVVIEGLSDEISWYVNYITDNGLIYVIRNGGSDHQIAPSKWVNIHTKKGIVKGVLAGQQFMLEIMLKRLHRRLIIFLLILEQKIKRKLKRWEFMLVVL